MTQVDRWLLPDGIHEVLPQQAQYIEQLRRRLLDLYARWGYELVIPPLLEFTESLLTHTNPDLDMQTFKVTDQLSGRSMGIRADITPQAARMDAHSLNRKGPVRLCYAGSVLHTRPAHALASRSPIQLGVECFGIPGLMADIEVISLMIETLRSVQIPRFVVSLGHVEIFRDLCAQTGLQAAQTTELLHIVQRKASVELDQFAQREKWTKAQLTRWRQMLTLHGDVAVLAQARTLLAEGGGRVLKAIAELEQIAGLLKIRYPEAQIHVDLAELPGYHYHNGVVFAAYVEGAGAAVANGGRYDALSELFGRARPATGFNADLKTLINLGALQNAVNSGVLVVAAEDELQWQAIVALRAKGERVVVLPAESLGAAGEVGCDRQLLLENGQFVVKSRT